MTTPAPPLGPTIPERSSDGGSARLEFFSDAILAIAITLLVISIHIPSVPAQHRAQWHLGHELLQLWPSYMAYVLSFCTIGLIWVAHHSLFRRIGDVDRPLLLINLALMMCVAFLPFSTAVLAGFSWKANVNSSVAVELYSLNMLAIGIAFLGLWLYLAGHRSLFLGQIERGSLNSSIRRSMIVPAAYVVTCALAYVSTVACYAIWLATTIYIAFGPATRKIPVWSSAGSKKAPTT